MAYSDLKKFTNIAPHNCTKMAASNQLGTAFDAKKATAVE
jgi:hypothetical protein